MCRKHGNRMNKIKIPDEYWSLTSEIKRISPDYDFMLNRLQFYCWIIVDITLEAQAIYYFDSQVIVVPGSTNA